MKITKRGMRIIAGILMIFVGFISVPTIVSLSAERFGFGETTTTIITLLSVVLLILIMGSAYNTFRRKNWRTTLAGAICSMLVGFAMLVYPVFVIFPLMGILAVIFLIKSKSEFE